MLPLFSIMTLWYDRMYNSSSKTYLLYNASKTVYVSNKAELYIPTIQSDNIFTLQNEKANENNF